MNSWFHFLSLSIGGPGRIFKHAMIGVGARDRQVMDCFSAALCVSLRCLRLYGS
jgi:hypothetical protein